MNKNKKCKEFTNKIAQLFNEFDELSLDDQYWVANKVYDFFVEPKTILLDEIDQLNKNAYSSKNFLMCTNL